MSTRQPKSFRVRAVEYLKKLMDSGELPTQEAVGMKLGISQQAIAKFLKDGVMGTPTINKLIALYPEARAFIYNPSDEAQPLDNPLEDNLMAVPLINAHGGIPEFWDDETMSTLPKYITTKRTDGNYAGFVISGDSMDYDGKFAICEGDIVLGEMKNFLKGGGKLPPPFH